jgi:hypothetical protein
MVVFKVGVGEEISDFAWNLTFVTWFAASQFAVTLRVSMHQSFEAYICG